MKFEVVCNASLIAKDIPKTLFYIIIINIAYPNRIISQYYAPIQTSMKE